MKKCVVLLVALLMSITTSVNARDRYHLIIEGEFLGGQNVKYEVYRVSDNASEKCFEGKKKHGFNLQVNVGENYLIKFVSKEGLEKDIFLKVTKSGTFDVDVDFTKNQSARITYDDHKGTYVVDPIPNERYSSLAEK